MEHFLAAGSIKLHSDRTMSLLRWINYRLPCPHLLHYSATHADKCCSTLADSFALQESLLCSRITERLPGLM